MTILHTLPETKSLPCGRNTRQKWFGTRRTICHVSTHDGPHTVANTTVKNLYRVPPARARQRKAGEWATRVPGRQFFTVCLCTHGKGFTMFRQLPCVLCVAGFGVPLFTVCLPLPCTSLFTMCYLPFSNHLVQNTPPRSTGCYIPRRGLHSRFFKVLSHVCEQDDHTSEIALPHLSISVMATW
jgi:hypothetical protein